MELKQNSTLIFSQLETKTTDADGKAILDNYLGQSFEQGRSYYVMVNKNKIKNFQYNK